MGTIEWYNAEKTIVRWTFQPGSTVEELIESFKEFNKMVDGIDHVVFTIIEFPRSGKIPPSILSHFSEIARLVPRIDNPHGQVGIVNNNLFFEQLIKLFGNVYFSRFVFFTSFEEAVADFEEKLARLAD